jgi:hypothetical protein
MVEESAFVERHTAMADGLLPFVALLWLALAVLVGVRPPVRTMFAVVAAGQSVIIHAGPPAARRAARRMSARREYVRPLVHLVDSSHRALGAGPVMDGDEREKRLHEHHGRRERGTGSGSL